MGANNIFNIFITVFYVFCRHFLNNRYQNKTSYNHKRTENLQITQYTTQLKILWGLYIHVSKEKNTLITLNTTKIWFLCNHNEFFVKPSLDII